MVTRLEALEVRCLVGKPMPVRSRFALHVGIASSYSICILTGCTYLSSYFPMVAKDRWCGPRWSILIGSWRRVCLRKVVRLMLPTSCTAIAS